MITPKELLELTREESEDFERLLVHVEEEIRKGRESLIRMGSRHIALLEHHSPVVLRRLVLEVIKSGWNAELITVDGATLKIFLPGGSQPIDDPNRRHERNPVTITEEDLRRYGLRP